MLLCILIVLMSIVVVLLVPVLRRFCFTRFIMVWFKKVLPPMSETEQAAIDAGDIWWEAELFRGKPDWKQLHQWKLAPLTEAENRFMEEQVSTLCALIDDWEITEKQRDLSPEVWNYLKREGFFGMIIPKAYGGLGFSARMHSEVIAAIATRSISAAVTTMVPNSLGPAELLLHYGTEAQKQYYLPRLAIGSEIPCFALTGPEAGSDAGAMPDTGIVVKEIVDGVSQLMISLSWDKRYITLAPVATVLGLAFKLKDPEGLLGGARERGITLCLIPTNHPGVEIGTRHWPLNAVFMNGPTRGNKVLIPLDWIIGGPACIGQGWRMLMDCLSAGRGISLPALSTAMGAVCFRGTSAYSVVRKQFKTPIGQFEGVAQGLAKIGAIQYGLEAGRLFTAMAIDQGVKPAVASAIVKYHMTEWGRVVINEAMDIHGGRGIILGPRNYLGRMYQAMPISITVEGANILTRNLIIFGQGAIRCHPYVLAEIQAIQSENLKAFDKAFTGHVCYTFGNIIRSIGLGFTRGRYQSVPSDLALGYIYRRTAWMSCVLAVLSDCAMLFLGGSLKRREALSARLGDVLSHLYLISGVLHYFHQQGQLEDEKIYVEWICGSLLKKTQETICAFLDNFPVRWVAKSLKYTLFPFGTGFYHPRDKQTHALAAHMQTDSMIRDKLTQVATPHKTLKTLSKPLALVENAFLAILKTSKLAKNLPKAKDLETALGLAREQGILSEMEGDQIRLAEAFRSDAIQVDEFSK